MPKPQKNIKRLYVEFEQGSPFWDFCRILSAPTFHSLLPLMGLDHPIPETIRPAVIEIARCLIIQNDDRYNSDGWFRHVRPPRNAVYRFTPDVSMTYHMAEAVKMVERLGDDEFSRVFLRCVTQHIPRNLITYDWRDFFRVWINVPHRSNLHKPAVFSAEKLTALQALWLGYFESIAKVRLKFLLLGNQIQISYERRHVFAYRVGLLHEIERRLEIKLMQDLRLLLSPEDLYRLQERLNRWALQVGMPPYPPLLD